MYYKSNGNYEAFANPKKPKTVDNKTAYFVGAGIASLAGATFLIRDGKMPGDKINIFEELAIPGGSLDGIFDPAKGFIIRGGREMENHFECLWDLFRSIPSLEVDGSVLDEFYWLNKEDPNSSKCRLIHKKGQRTEDDGKFTLSEESSKAMIELFFTREQDLNNKKIDEVFPKDFFTSNFWYYWCSMFAFETWHSAMEMRRYVMRFIHHIEGLPDLSALKFTKYNQYESLVLPLVKFLKEKGVNFHYQTIVKNIIIDQNQNGEKIAKKIILEKSNKKEEIELTEDNLVFVTNGSITESTTRGSHKEKAPSTNELGGSWELWVKLAQQSPDFGKPEKFYDNLPKESWFISATLTTLDEKITPYIEKISKRDPYANRVVTGGIVTVIDSNWFMSYTLNRQPHFKNQPKEQLVVWIYGLLSNKEGNYVKKSITECTGMEIAQEWLYHIGVPKEDIINLATSSCNVVPVYMPYITSYFMPRELGDRPLVIPKGSKNLAFIGNFAETEDDTVFTTEYSVRTAMEAVYKLLDIDRGVPEVFASAYDLRILLKSTCVLTDYKRISDIKVPLLLKIFEKEARKKIKKTFIEQLLFKSGLLEEEKND